MKARSVAEEVLVMLLWAGDKLTRPTLANLTESWEAWEWRTGVRRQLPRMEHRQLVAREQHGTDLVYRLTQLGRLAALGGQDVVARWERPWDGRWRQVLFDLPAGISRTRVRLWRWLRENGFGYLQQSVWIHPDPVAAVLEALRDFHDDVESFILMEAQCCAGYTNDAVVNGAWDFAEINKRYASYIRTATISERELTRLRAAPATLAGWLRVERSAWQHALALDPLLPRTLLPADYRGREAWEVRRHCHRTVAALFA
jgi:phenylacetic acid degradation operon negative regulatory protein